LVESLLRSNDKHTWEKETTWATLFCAVLLFAMLLEESQISYDVFVQTNIDPTLSRRDSREFIETSNRQFYRYFKEAFHYRYHTYDPRKKHRHYLNPFRTGSVELYPASECLVSAINEIKE